MIAKNYVTGWFIFDFVSSVPLDYNHREWKSEQVR